jgi:hypothetical protein
VLDPSFRQRHIERHILEIFDISESHCRRLVAKFIKSYPAEKTR